MGIGKLKTDLVRRPIPDHFPPRTPVKYERCGFNRYFDELEIVMNDALNRWFQVAPFNV